jgi:DNA-binding response OmpR family regulator
MATILVIEPNGPLRRMLQRMLCHAGHFVHGSPRGPHVHREGSQKPRPSLVIADAGLDAPENVALEMRRAFCAPVIVLCAAQPQSPRADTRGFVLLEKPFSTAELKAAVALALPSDQVCAESRDH